MTRIADTELERLKREVSLARLIEGQEHRLVLQGKDLACRCPRHESDETLSCIVTPKSNLWHCFGCDAGGTVIDWVMCSHRVSCRHACALLLKEHPVLVAGAAEPATGVTSKRSQGKLRRAQSLALETDADEAASDQRLLDQVIKFYHETLLARPGGADVSGGSRPRQPGAHRAFQARLCEPHARLIGKGCWWVTSSLPRRIAARNFVTEFLI